MKTYELRNNRDGSPSLKKTVLSIGVEKRCLKAVFECEDSKLYSAGSNYNDPLYEGDVVELFIYTGVKNHYLEIEVSPNNAHFVGDIENEDRSPKLTLLQEDVMDTKVEPWKDGYKTTILIPLAKLGCDKETIKFNAFRIETEGGHKEAHLISLNPTMCGSFHVASCLKTSIE